MKIVALQEENMPRVVLRVETILCSGGIVISPTDTVYGILGSAANVRALQSMFQLKNRPEEKAFPIFVCDIPMARRYAYISDAKVRFLEKVWPGPVTMVFHHKENLPKVLTGGKDTIGIRIPNDPFLAELLKRVDAPLAQTSANISNEPPAENMERIKHYFEKSKVRPDLVIDRGEVHGKSSTILDFTGNEPIILRTGTVSKEELDEIVKTMLQ